MSTDQAPGAHPRARPGRGRHGAAAVAAAALLLVCHAPRIGAAPLVLHRFSSPRPDLQVEEVLYLAAGSALMQAGLSSTRQGEEGDYVLEAHYAPGAETTEVQYTFLPTHEPLVILASTTVALHADGSLDEEVAAAVAGLLKDAGISPAPSLEARIEGLLPEAAPTVAEGPPKPTGAAIAEAPAPAATPAPAEAPAPAATPTTSEAPASAEAATTEGPAETSPQAVPAPAGPSEAPPAAAPPEGSSASAPVVPTNPEGPPVAVSEEALPARVPAARFESSISPAGAMFFGTIASYLHYGVGGLLTAGVTWPRPSWSLTLGAEASFIRPLNDAGVTGGPLSLTTAGPRVQISTGVDLPYRLAVGVSGGAAVIIAGGTGKTLAKTAPYADAVVQAAVPIGRSLLVGAEARFLVIVADDVVILAALPSLVVRIEL